MLPPGRCLVPLRRRLLALHLLPLLHLRLTLHLRTARTLPQLLLLLPLHLLPLHLLWPRLLTRGL